MAEKVIESSTKAIDLIETISPRGHFYLIHFLCTSLYSAVTDKSDLEIEALELGQSITELGVEEKYALVEHLIEKTKSFQKEG